MHTVTTASIMQRRPAAPRDAALLRELFAETRGDLLLQPPDTRELMIDMQFRAQRRRQQLEHPTARHEVVVVDGVALGYLVLDGDQSTLQIVELAVRRSTRGRGIGSAVLAELIADATATGRELRLRAWSQDTRALALYERHGFVHVGTAGGYAELYRPVG